MKEHGTRARYSQGCRCQPCTEANTAYSRARQVPRDAYNLPTIPFIETTWMDRAACKGRSDLFFPAPGSGNRNHRYHEAAATICNGCPVQDNCRHYAIAIGARHGVWAGVPARQLQAS